MNKSGITVCKTKETLRMLNIYIPSYLDERAEDKNLKVLNI